MTAKVEASLNEMEKDKVLRYVSFLLGHFRLGEWTILLSAVPTMADDERPDDANIHTYNLRYNAVLQVSPYWERMTDEDKREVLVHEVLHLWSRDLKLRQLEWCAKLSGDLPGYALSDLSDTEERMVDRMASALAPHLPQYPGPLEDPIPNVRLDQGWS